MSLSVNSETVDAVLLPWSYSEWPTGVKHHRAQLERLAREGRFAWIRFNSVFAETQFRLTSVEYTFPDSGSSEEIYRQLRDWQPPHRTKFHRTYLVAQEHVEEPCYDITDYVQRCLSGDFSIANRFRGRTIFRLHQTSRSAYDLLSVPGTNAAAGRILRTYIHEFTRFLGHVVIGFSFQLPPFLSPLNAPAREVPWSPHLSEHFQSVWQAPLTDYLPQVFYGAHGASAVRSRFWRELTNQFAEICIGSFRELCNDLGLRVAIEIPESPETLRFDLGAILKYTDGPILIGTEDGKSTGAKPEETQSDTRAGNDVAQPHISNTNLTSTPEQLLLAKWIASQLEGEHSQTVTVCRAKPPSAEQRSYDAVLGFTSWLSGSPGKPSRKGPKPENNLSTIPINSDRSSPEQSNHYRSERALSIGVPQRSILMISPIHSLWSEANEETWNDTTQSWEWLSQTVWNLGYDFDIATETDFVTSEFNKKKRALHINERFYQVVLLPSCASLQRTTVLRLTEVLTGRGKLVSVEPVPYLLQGKLSRDTHPLELLLYHRRTSMLKGPLDEKTETLKHLLEKWIKPALQIYIRPDNTPTGVIRLHHRQTKKLNLYYLFNTSEHNMETLVEIRGEALEVEAWPTTNDERLVLDYWHANGNTYLTQSFNPWESKLIAAKIK